MLDLFALVSPRLNNVTRKGYLSVINRCPRVWSAFYAWMDRSNVLSRHLWLLRKEMALLGRRLTEAPAGVVCSAYPAYGFMAEPMRRSGALKTEFFNLVTDSITINRLWTRPACDGWFVPNPETAAVVAAQGVPDTLIHDLGFPVQLDFGRLGGQLCPPDLAAGAPPRVLHMMHSGLQHAEATALKLMRETRWELTFAVGRDERLRERLLRESRVRKAPTTVLSWTNQIPRLLMTHHVVISKAGGATTQEAIAARCPMLVNQIVPGQEEGNYELLRSRGIGAHAADPAAILGVLQGAFADGGRQWLQWRTAISQLSRVDAAPRIAQKLLASAEQFKRRSQA